MYVGASWLRKHTQTHWLNEMWYGIFARKEMRTACSLYDISPYTAGRGGERGEGEGSVVAMGRAVLFRFCVGWCECGLCVAVFWPLCGMSGKHLILITIIVAVAHVTISRSCVCRVCVCGRTRGNPQITRHIRCAQTRRASTMKTTTPTTTTRTTTTICAQSLVGVAFWEWSGGGSRRTCVRVTFRFVRCLSDHNIWMMVRINLLYSGNYWFTRVAQQQGLCVDFLRFGAESEPKPWWRSRSGQQ